MEVTMAYVSLTLINVRSFWSLPKFYWHAMRTHKAAMLASGNLQVSTKAFGVFTHGTMTLWDSRQAMIGYVRGMVHLEAMRAFDQIGTGAVYGYDAAQLPSWEEASHLLAEHGRDV